MFGSIGVVPTNGYNIGSDLVTPPLLLGVDKARKEGCLKMVVGCHVIRTGEFLKPHYPCMSKK